VIELENDDEDLGQVLPLRSSSADPLDTIPHPFDDLRDDLLIPPEGPATKRVRKRLDEKYPNRTVESNEWQPPIVPIGSIKDKIDFFNQPVQHIRTNMKGRGPNKVGNLPFFARVGIHPNSQADELALHQIRKKDKDSIATSVTPYKGNYWLEVEEFYLGLNRYPNESDPMLSSYCLSWDGPEGRKMTIKNGGGGPSKHKVEFQPRSDVVSLEVCSNRCFCRGHHWMVPRYPEQKTLGI
jgi:hypothetical protein